MNIKITYNDGSTDDFYKVEDSEFGDNFLSLNDEEGNTICDIAIENIKKVKYD